MVSQFAHKQPTRFNEPEIPQDLATKGYVDNLTSDSSYVLGTAIIDSVTNAIVEFNAPFERLAWNSSEAIRRFLMPVTAICNNFSVHISTNTKNGEVIYTVHIDLSASIMTVTVPSSTTGKFQDLVNSATVTNNDFIQFEGDSTASATGVSNVNSLGVRAVST